MSNFDPKLPEPEADCFLLAAGHGTRLRPLTNNKPKPLIQVGGKALIDWNLRLVRRSGFRRVIVNVHYLADQIRDFIGNGSRWDLVVEYSQEDPILDTGGGIRNIEAFLSQPRVLCMNSDTLFGSDFDLAGFVRRHMNHPRKPVASVVVREDSRAKEFGALGIDASGELVEFRGAKCQGGAVAQVVMFAGVQVLERSVFRHMPPAGSVFSITRDTWVELLNAGECIACETYGGFWSDVGTLERLAQLPENIATLIGGN